MDFGMWPFQASFYITILKKQCLTVKALGLPQVLKQQLKVNKDMFLIQYLRSNKHSFFCQLNLLNIVPLSQSGVNVASISKLGILLDLKQCCLSV